MKSRDEVKLGARKASELRRSIFNEMLRTRPHKYKRWLIGMSMAKSVAGLIGQHDRAEVVVSLYAALHKVDDVADGDAVLSHRHSSAAGYVRDKIRFVLNQGAPRDDVEWLLSYSFALATETGLNIEMEVCGILMSILFDAERRNSLVPQKVRRVILQENFDRLDIVWTIGLCLKLFKEKIVKHSDLRELGEAARIQYTLEDIEEDFRAGYCNIPLEDIERFKINALDSSSIPVQRWCRQEARRGLKLLDEYGRKKSKLSLRLFTRSVLYLFYERPARKHFELALRDK